MVETSQRLFTGGARTLAPMSRAAEAEQLVKHYGGRAGTVEAVRGVDLGVGRGGA